MCQITTLGIFLFMLDSAQRFDLAPIFAELSQIEKLFEIKPPLAMHTIPAKVKIENKMNDVPLKKPKLEMDVKPKIETDFVVKKESIDEFNKGTEIMDNMNLNILVKAEVQNENPVPLKKPKLEMEFKPKIETDFQAKSEPIDDINRGMEIIGNMKNIPMKKDSQYLYSIS